MWKGSPPPRAHSAGAPTALSTTQTWPKLKNGLRAVESNGSWCIDARLTHLPALRASVFVAQQIHRLVGGEPSQRLLEDDLPHGVADLTPPWAKKR